MKPIRTYPANLRVRDEYCIHLTGLYARIGKLAVCHTIGGYGCNAKYRL